jgi:hypothetical protein
MVCKTLYGGSDPQRPQQVSENLFRCIRFTSKNNFLHKKYYIQLQIVDDIVILIVLNELT